MVLFGCSVAIVAHYNYWDGVDPARTISASFLGFGTVFLGVSGLIALDTRPDGLNGARLYMLVLLLDCAAFLSSIAGATVSSEHTSRAKMEHADGSLSVS